MEISKLQIKNFLSISSVELKPGQVTQITGKNGQGKTSILKALEFAVKGGGDGSLVKHGEDSAEVIVELSDNTSIRRRMTNDGKQSLDVKREGFSAPKPQAYLDSLFADYAFNPMNVLDVKQRTMCILNSIDIKVTANTLAGELGVDPEKLPPLEYDQHGLSVINQAHKFYYQRRAEANKDTEAKKKRWETYLADLPRDVPESTKSKAEVQAEIEQVNRDLVFAEQKINENKSANVRRTEALDRVKRYESRVKEIEQQIAGLQLTLEEGKKFVSQAKAEVPAEIPVEAESLKAYNDLAIKREQIKGQLSSAEAAESVAKQRQMVTAMENEYQTAKAFAESLNQKVEQLAGPIKAKLMQSVQMPIAGLEFKDEQFLVNGVPVDNLSTAQSISLAIGVARKLAGKSKLICLDGAESLDEESYQVLRKEIEGDGYNYFLTKVGEPFDGPTDTVLKMENGEVRV